MHRRGIGYGVAALLLGAAITLVGLLGWRPYCDRMFMSLSAAGMGSYKAGRIAEATQRLENALWWAPGTSHSDEAIAATQHVLGICFFQGHEFAEAVRRHRAAIACLEKIHVRGDFRVLEVKHDLAVSLMGDGDYTEAAAVMSGVVADMRDSLGRGHREFPGALIDLATIYMREHRYTLAKEALDEAVQVAGDVHGLSSPARARALFAMGDLLRLQDEPGPARAMYEQSLRIGVAVLGRNDPLIDAARKHLAELPDSKPSSTTAASQGSDPRGG